MECPNDVKSVILASSHQCVAWLYRPCSFSSSVYGRFCILKDLYLRKFYMSQKALRVNLVFWRIIILSVMCQCFLFSFPSQMWHLPALIPGSLKLCAFASQQRRCRQHGGPQGQPVDNNPIHFEVHKVYPHKCEYVNCIVVHDVPKPHLLQMQSEWSIMTKLFFLVLFSQPTLILFWDLQCLLVW